MLRLRLVCLVWSTWQGMRGKRARQMRVAHLVLASILPRIAALRDSKLIFQSQLSLLQNAAAGAPPPQDSFPHARSTSKFGEILWRANDAARAHEETTGEACAQDSAGTSRLAYGDSYARGIYFGQRVELPACQA